MKTVSDNMIFKMLSKTIIVVAIISIARCFFTNIS